MKTLLEGDSGAGKTTYVLGYMKAMSNNCAGFISRRIIDEQGRAMGFYLDEPSASANITLCDAKKAWERVFLYGLPPHRDLTLDALRLIPDIGKYDQQNDLYVMDEVGGLELLIPSLRDFLEGVFESNIPCIGTIKSKENLERMARNLGMPELIPLAREFKTRFINRHGGKIIRINGGTTT